MRDRHAQVGDYRCHALCCTRRGTMRVPMRLCTASPCWFSVVVRTLSSPWSGRDCDGRTSSTSLSTRSSSPGRTGRGQRHASTPVPTMPPAGGQSAEDGVTRRCLIEMEGLWIEGGGKGGDLLRIDPQPPGAERWPHGKIFEIALSHGSVSPLYTRRGAATSQWDRTRHRAPPLRR